MGLPGAIRLTRSLVEGWIASTSLLKPGSRAHRLYVMRSFGRYLVQTHPQSYVPPLIAGPKCESTFRPHIYTSIEIKLLLDEAARLTPTGSLRPLTFVTLLSLLYCTGLRISEALSLRLSDVDLEAGVLLIRDSKFRKTRAAPLATDATHALSRYVEARRSFHHRMDPETPFFVNEWRRGCEYPATIATFLVIARRVGIRGAPGTPGPRIHDLRQHADLPIMPTPCRRQRCGRPRGVSGIGIIKGSPERPTVYRQDDIVRG
jgi:site-specific recombinase XerD